MKTSSKIGTLLLVIAFLMALMLMAVTPAFADDADEKVEIEANPVATEWIPDQKVSLTNQNDYFPSIASIGGDLWVAYEHYNTTTGYYDIHVTKSTDGGITWTLMRAKSYSGYSLRQPSIAIDVYRNWIYVAYERVYSSTDYDIWLDRYNGTGWYTELVDNSGATNDQNPTIVCEYDQYGSNDVYIVWERRVSSTDIDLVFANSSTYGDSWSQSNLYLTTNLAHQPSMAYAQGYIYVAFRIGNSTDGSIYLRRSINGGETWGTYSVESYSADCSEPSVASYRRCRRQWRR